MLCEKCKKRTATVFYNENINGKTKSYSLCGECAAKLREKGDIQDITSMIGSFADPFSELHDNLFGGFFGMPTLLSVPTEKKCPTCGSTYAVHGTTSHTGAIPARHRAKQERREQLKNLRNSLQEAIEKEDFERAATLRDEIRKMESQNEKDGE